jgi:hypothetical protein
MLIVNSKTLNPNTKDPDIADFAKEYRDKVQELKTRFTSGHIQLRRNGYPKMNKNADGTMNMPEIPAPIFIKYTRTDANGAVWGYCKSRPLIHPNGLVEVPPNDNSEVLDGEVISLDLRGKPDHAFYIMFKSGVVGTEFQVYDPEGDRIRELTEKNKKLRVQSCIRDVSEEKLRLMAQAWGVKGASTRDPLILQDELEEKVFKMEEQKVKNPTNLMLKGIAEFLAEYKDDEITRPRAIVNKAIEEKRLTFNPVQSKYLFDGTDVLWVPPNRYEDKEFFLSQTITEVKHKDKWMLVLRGMLTPEYVEGLDKWGLHWACKEFDIPLNQKEDKLRTALLAALQ